MTPRVEAERAIAATLLGHGWHKYGVASQPPRWWPMCGCGKSFRNLRYDQAFNAHRAHVASVLADLMAERQAEAWDEGRDTGHEDTYLNLIEGRGDFDAIETPNPYRPDPKDTRDE